MRAIVMRVRTADSLLGWWAAARLSGGRVRPDRNGILFVFRRACADSSSGDSVRRRVEGT